MRNTRMILSLFAAFVVTSAHGSEVVAELSGSGSTTTREFEVKAPWIVDWRINSDFPQSMAIEISLVDAATGFHDGLILQTKYRGNGVKLFRQSGRYRFRISSTLTYWSLRVEELSRQEAEQYTPRAAGGSSGTD